MSTDSTRTQTHMEPGQPHFMGREIPSEPIVAQATQVFLSMRSEYLRRAVKEPSSADS